MSRESTKQNQSIFPVAVCAYKPDRQLWKVEPTSGETLALRNIGNAWEIVKDEVLLLHARISSRAGVFRRNGVMQQRAASDVKCENGR